MKECDCFRGYFKLPSFQAHGVIFVIDSSDFSRFDEVKFVLEDILGSSKIAGKPILILANKQDNENALDEIDIIEYLNIESIVNHQKCPTLVQSCSATENNSKLDPGIKKGYEWLLNNIVRHYSNLNNRVETESKQQELQEREDMTEKIRRIREQNIEKNRANQDVIETYSDYIQKISSNNVEREEQVIIDVGFENVELNSTSSNSSSSISFPPIYVSKKCGLTERPKSAIQIVKHQLEMNKTMRKHSLPVKSNRTAPVNLYGDKPPHSAQERRRDFSTGKRNLKSADDSSTMNNLPTNGINHMGPSGDYLPLKDLFQTNHNTKLPPLNCKNKIVPLVQKPTNGDAISVIEIE